MTIERRTVVLGLCTLGAVAFSGQALAENQVYTLEQISTAIESYEKRRKKLVDALNDKKLALSPERRKKISDEIDRIDKYISNLKENK
jgi:hypothetical protein